MSKIQAYVCPTETSEDGVRAARVLLNRYADRVQRFECDIPLSQSETWPASVREAAAVLAAVKPPGRGESDTYRQTGVLGRGDEQQWEAFVEFAPYAYDASAWAERGEPLIDLSDCGQSVVLRVDSEEAVAASRALMGAGLPALKTA